MGTTVYIPVFSGYIQGKIFSRDGENPGCGGTQFCSVKLAFFLAESHPDYRVVLLNQEPISLEAPPENLVQYRIGSFEAFLEAGVADVEHAVLIVTMSIIKRTPPALIEAYRRRVIAWIHHPFEYDFAVRRQRLASHVCVGTYQYYSNRSFYGPIWHIQNIFQAPAALHAPMSCPGETNGDSIRIVYLGALIRPKGFLHVARKWPAIRKNFPNAELHVIGSTATHGRAPRNELVPSDPDFAEEVLRFISRDDIEAGRVVFYGNLGPEKFDILRQAHAAILNPRGQTEAFPAAPLECMGAGLPVIASDDYGMSDSMRFFPELILNSPEQMVERLGYLFSDRTRYVQFQHRALAVAKWFEMQNGETIARWRRLIDAVAVVGPPVDSAPPLFGPYGSPLRLRRRSMRKWRRALKSWLVDRAGARRGGEGRHQTV